MLSKWHIRILFLLLYFWYSSFMDEFPLEKLISKHIALDELPQIVMEMSKDTLDFPGKVLVYP